MTTLKHFFLQNFTSYEQLKFHAHLSCMKKMYILGATRYHLNSSAQLQRLARILKT